MRALALIALAAAVQSDPTGQAWVDRCVTAIEDSSWNSNLLGPRPSHYEIRYRCIRNWNATHPADPVQDVP